MNKYAIVTEGTVSTLKILNFDKSDAGEYYVALSEKETSAPAHITLEVAPEVKIKEDLGEELTKTAHTDLDFHVEASGNPQPTVTILHNGERIQSRAKVDVAEYDDTVSVRMKNLTMDDIGTIKIIAENASGVAQKEIRLNVIDLPSEPLELQAKNITKDSTMLFWQPPTETNGSPVIGYVIERKSVDSNRWRTIGKTDARTLAFEAQDLLSKQVYGFRVLAVNEAGEGPPCHPIDIITKDEDAIIPEEVVSLETPEAPIAELDGTDAVVSWTPVPNGILYRLERRQDLSEWMELMTTGETKFVDTFLKESGSYTYRVTAKNANSESAPSEESAPIHLVKEEKIPDGILEEEKEKPQDESQETPKDEQKPEVVDDVKENGEAAKNITPSYKDGTAQLIIKDADVSNSGVYNLKATNADGTGSADVTLVVKYTAGTAGPHRFRVAAENAVGTGPTIESEAVAAGSKPELIRPKGDATFVFNEGDTAELNFSFKVEEPKQEPREEESPEVVDYDSLDSTVDLSDRKSIDANRLPNDLEAKIMEDDMLMSEKEVKDYMRQILQGLEHMHNKQIVHLDLKVGIALIFDIKIIDFGLARKLDPKKTEKLLFGTPEFCAPEVVNYEPVGLSTDMWSVGVIAYVLLSGLSPFFGATDEETLANVSAADWDFDDAAWDDVSETAKVHGDYPPSVKKQLEDIVAYVGDLIATLSCEVDGAPEPRITWFKDEKELNVPSIKFDSQYSEGSAELTVKNIEQADAGTYRCRATNALGSVTTEAKMTVEKRKEKTKPTDDEKDTKKTTKVMEGAEMILTCVVTGTPYPKIKWSKDGTSPSLGYASDDSRAPVITRPLVDTVVKAGQSFRGCREILELEVDGTPTPMIEWYHDGKLVSETRTDSTSASWLRDGKPLDYGETFRSRAFDDGIATLEIVNFTQQLCGTYTVVAFNRAGEAHSSAIVKLEHIEEKVGSIVSRYYFHKGPRGLDYPPPPQDM
ncbi:immunoglobulin I-set domain protein [Ancylostoma ceylanicum]|uniref:Immunoglobulin I-set domain protein n=1 Tax=Ancylostoma ceylanicum TaxID=53326 RepID=A0A0D6L7V6_9BILA|nr:immunoglobulin I-set domain protein [Ancylostoma ceylanicum]